MLRWVVLLTHASLVWSCLPSWLVLPLPHSVCVVLPSLPSFWSGSVGFPRTFCWVVLLGLILLLVVMSSSSFERCCFHPVQLPFSFVLVNCMSSL